MGMGLEKEVKVLLKLNKNNQEKTSQNEIIQTPTQFFFFSPSN